MLVGSAVVTVLDVPVLVGFVELAALDVGVVVPVARIDFCS